MPTSPIRRRRPSAWATTVAAAILVVAVVLVITLADLPRNSTDDHGAVNMTATRFAPDTTTITKGSRLRLVNRSGYGHTLAIDTNASAGPAAGAPNLAATGVRRIGPGEQWATPPWLTAGTFRLTCTIHPHMNLTVHVVG